MRYLDIHYSRKNSTDVEAIEDVSTPAVLSARKKYSYCEINESTAFP